MVEPFSLTEPRPPSRGEAETRPAVRWRHRGPGLPSLRRVPQQCRAPGTSGGVGASRRPGSGNRHRALPAMSRCVSVAHPDTRRESLQRARARSLFRRTRLRGEDPVRRSARGRGRPASRPHGNTARDRVRARRAAPGRGESRLEGGGDRDDGELRPLRLVALRGRGRGRDRGGRLHPDARVGRHPAGRRPGASLRSDGALATGERGAPSRRPGLHRRPQRVLPEHERREPIPAASRAPLGDQPESHLPALPCRRLLSRSLRRR